MNSILTFPTLLASALLSTSFAQSIETPQVPLASEDDKRTAKNIAAAAAETLRNKSTNAPDALYKRALEAQMQRGKYLKNFSEAKVRPFPEVVKNWDSYQAQVASLAPSYQSFLSATTPEEKTKLGTPLLESMQSVGRFLKSATHAGAKSQFLTKQQAEEQENLMLAYNTAPSSDDGGKLALTTPDIFYTLKHLPIPIVFNAPKGTEIFLFSELGGRFENKLNYMRIAADENGIARTWWASDGDGVSACNIMYRSSEYPAKGRITPYVKSLKLMELETLSPIAKTAIEQGPEKAKSIKGQALKLQ